MITVTFYASTKNCRRVQKLVGECGGYFRVNPLHTVNGRTLFDVSFDDVNSHKYPKFSACTLIIEQPYF